MYMRLQMSDISANRNTSKVSPRKILLFWLLLFSTALPTLTGEDSLPDNEHNLALGIPGAADIIVNREGYALGYNEQHKQSAWVTYKLTLHRLQNPVVARTGKFRLDPMLHGKRAALKDYRNSGYDRGHLAPAADMKWSRQAMNESFYISNISPQVPAFNRGIWAKLESQIRSFAIAEQEIFVVTGPVLPQDTPQLTIGSNQVTVPSHYYKVVYDLTPPQKMIAFIIPNQGSNKSLQDFAVKVDAVESVTGLDFFSSIPGDKQEQMESNIDITLWNWDE